MIRPEDQRLLKPYLLPGERLLWAGRPKAGLIFRRSDLYLLPIGLVFGALTFAHYRPSTFDGPLSVALGLLVAVIAVNHAIGRFIREARFRAGLLYAVSNRRVIALNIGRDRGFEALDLGYLPSLELDHERGDRGTLRFADKDKGDPLVAIDYRGWSPSGTNRPGFEDIEHPQMVYNLIARESDLRCRELLDSTVEDPIFAR